MRTGGNRRAITVECRGRGNTCKLFKSEIKVCSAIQVTEDGELKSSEEKMQLFYETVKGRYITPSWSLPHRCVLKTLAPIEILRKGSEV